MIRLDRGLRVKRPRRPSFGWCTTTVQPLSSYSSADWYPELLCSGSGVGHAGTTDVDVQVNLEIAAGSTNMARLEQALGNAEFTPDTERIWRWQTDIDGQRAVVKFELLADLDDAPAGAVVSFDECEKLGAINLWGTGFAARDCSPRPMRARIGGSTIGSR